MSDDPEKPDAIAPDTPPETEAPAADSPPEIVVAPPDEEAIAAAIAEHDQYVGDEIRRLTRRGFLTAAVAAAAGVGTWAWLRTRPRVGDLAWPFRRVLELNETLAMAYFSRTRLNPTFPPSRITRPARINGGLGLTANYDPANWRLAIEGVAGSLSPISLTLDDVRSFPRRDLITELRCIEGWSIIVQWTGARLSDVMSKFPPPTRDGRNTGKVVRYVAMTSPGNGYYVGLDMQSALHPQTLLAYEMNGQPLTWQHGAPLRLAIPVKLRHQEHQAHRHHPLHRHPSRRLLGRTGLRLVRGALAGTRPWCVIPSRRSRVGTKSRSDEGR